MSFKRIKIDFNSNWDFYLETLKSQRKSNFSIRNFREIKNRKTVSLPHDWSIEQEFTKEYGAENESGSLPGGIGWYTKTIAKEEAEKYKEKHTELSFGGVYQRAFIFVNGVEAASNLYGYNSFSVDISQWFSVPQDVEITVLVINQLPNSRWYSGSGIYRKVFLTITDNIYIDSDGIYITAPNLSETYTGEATAEITAEAVNRGKEAILCNVKHEIYNGRGELQGEALSEKYEIAGGEKQQITTNIMILKPELWSIENPVLYTVKTKIISSNRICDECDTQYGFRWFSYSSEKGFSLNGEPLKIKGVCLHHDHGSLGAKAYTDAIRRQLEIMKDMGANAVRTAHNPASEELIDLCGRMGLLVIEEAFDTWDKSKKKYDFAYLFNKKLSGTSLNLSGAGKMTWAEFVIKSMIRRDRNSPAVFMWSLGNEIQGDNSRKTSSRLANYAEEADPYVKGGRKKIYAEDDIRAGINDKWADTIRGFSSFDKEGGSFSVAGVNYIDSGAFEQIKRDYPDIYMLSTESSSALRSRGEYFHAETVKDDYNTDTKAAENSQMSSYDNETASWANTAMFDWQYDISLDYVLGEFVWTGFDYLGEPTPFTDNAEDFYPYASYFGIADTAGFKKDIYYFYKSQWKNPQTEPVLHLLPCLHLRKEQLTEEGDVLVVAYTNADAAELKAKKHESGSEYISFGVKSFKTKKSSAGLRTYKINSDESAVYKMGLEWRVPYEKYKDYIIYADALTEENKTDLRFLKSTGRKILKRSGGAVKLSLKEYSYRFPLENSDDYTLHYITVTAEDKQGQTDSSYGGKITFEIKGQGEIIGVDNGNSCDADKKKYSEKTSINAFHGKALAIVKLKKNENAELFVRGEEITHEIEKFILLNGKNLK